MHLLTVVLWISAFLTILSLALLAAIVLLRSGTDRRLRRSERFRNAARPLLAEHVAGRAPLEGILTLLGKDREMAAGLLMTESSRMEAKDRHLLRTLIGALRCTETAETELSSRNPEKRLRAAERLGYLGSEHSVPLLRGLLSDDVLSVRFAASEALARLGCRECVGEILRSIDVRGEVSQRRAAEVILILGPAASDPILAILGDPGGSVNSLAIAIRVAGSLRLREASGQLEKLLSHPEANIRLNAVRSLASLGDASAAGAITALASDDSWEVRSAVMQGLGRLGFADGIPLLLRGLSDGQWWVRFNAARALHDLGDQGVSALKEASELLTDPFGRDISLQVLEEHGIVNKATRTTNP